MKPPKYEPPSRVLIEQALKQASTFADVRKPRLIAAETKRIMPREMIVLEEDLVDLMKESPEEVPPIVVAPWGDVHIVVDGHHRLAGALEAGHKVIWVIEADLHKLKYADFPEWY